MQKAEGARNKWFASPFQKAVACISQPPLLTYRLACIKTRSVTAPVQGRGMSDNGENLV